MEKKEMIEECNLDLYLTWEYLNTFTKNEPTTKEALRNFIKTSMPTKTSKEVQDFLNDWYLVIGRFRIAKKAQIGYLRKYGWSIDRIRRRLKRSPNYILEHQYEPYDFLVFGGDKGNKWKIHKREQRRIDNAKNSDEPIPIPPRSGIHGEDDQENFEHVREFLYELYPHMKEFLKQMKKLEYKI